MQRLTTHRKINLFEAQRSIPRVFTPSRSVANHSIGKTTFKAHALLISTLGLWVRHHDVRRWDFPMGEQTLSTITATSTNVGFF